MRNNMQVSILVFIIFILIVLLLIGWGLFYLQRLTLVSIPTSSPSVSEPSFTPTVTPSQATQSPQPSTSYCNPSDLEASFNLSPGAGNVYGTFTLKNISSNNCQILGGNFIEVTYPDSVKNLSVTHMGQTQSQPFTLTPYQTLYSQVHYPNGPQCQGQTVPVSVAFSYKISPTDSVTFKNQGENPAVVQSCSSTNQITQIEIWEMSDQPIVPSP